MRINRKAIFLLSGILFLTAGMAYSQEVKYQRPSAEVEEMILAKPLPKIVFNNQLTEGVIYQPEVKYQPLSYIESIKEFKVAGLRLNGDNFSQTRKAFYENIELITAATGVTRPIAGLPKGLMAHDFKWSPDGRWLCFLNDTPKEVELYRVDVKAAEPVAEKIHERPVNSIFDAVYSFIGNDAVLYKSVPRNIGPFPEEKLPEGPIVQSSNGRKDTYRTYQDLLKSPNDEAVFEYLCTAELSLYDGTSTRTLGKPGIISAFSVSPDYNYVMYTTIH
ncbi:MAG: PD40 domain-containing protein, partial [Bacteroidales bacterium]|nr:PD40 domain-containing protein [Bacteroidales bacterium]